MKSNILAFFFTLGSIAMAVLIVWFYGLSDRLAPEMRFVAMDLVYGPNTTEAELLKGATAYDAKDGDISKRIVVEKTILNEDHETAVVYYAVSDLSGNVTKMSRVFPADMEALNYSGTGDVINEENELPLEGGVAGIIDGTVTNTTEGAVTGNIESNSLIGELLTIDGVEIKGVNDGENASGENNTGEGASADNTGE